MVEEHERVTVRYAAPDDAAAMARVLIDTYRIAHRGQVPDRLLDFPPVEEAYAESERNWRRALVEIAETAHLRERIFVAVEGKVIVGLGMGLPRAMLEPEFARFAGEVVCLYVLSTYQGRGIGRQLLRAIFEHLVRANLLPIAIACVTANLPARRFYEALGGQVVGERIRVDDGISLPETVYGWTTREVAQLLGENWRDHPRETKARSYRPKLRSLGIGDSGRTDIA
jgi:ribosomal protein S18 acetylase RimI-like enzyme